MSLKLAVWDVDGTLVDSRSLIHQAAAAASRAVGIAEPTYDAVRQIVGLSLHDALPALEPDLSPAGHAAYIAAFQSWFQAAHAGPNFVEPLYDGAEDCLFRLKAEGWLLAIATGNSRRGVKRLLDSRGWHSLFDAAWCADDGPGKPHPHMLLGAISELGCLPQHAVMIGDTSYDMQMAVAAGAYPLGVAWGFHTPDEIAEAGAAHIAATFDELEAELDAFAASRRRAGFDFRPSVAGGSALN